MTSEYGKITVYTKPGCQACTSTKRLLARHGMDHTEIDISNDEEARQMLIDMDYQTMPVVHIEHKGANYWWSGYRPDRIKDWSN